MLPMGSGFTATVVVYSHRGSGINYTIIKCSLQHQSGANAPEMRDPHNEKPVPAQMSGRQDELNGQMALERSS